MAQIHNAKLVSTSGKLRVIQSVVDKQIRYIGSKASWKLTGAHSYETLDRILARGIRRITGNMPSFPQRLIWADRTTGGLGIHSITQSAQEDKLANMAQAYREGGARATTMDCLVQQVMTDSGQSRVGPCTIQPIAHRRTTSWLSSAVCWLHQVGLTISMNSFNGETRQCQVRTLCPSLDPDELNLLHIHNVTTVGELVMEGDTDCPLFGPVIAKYPFSRDKSGWSQET